MRRATADDTQLIWNWTRIDFGAFLVEPMNVCLIEGDGGALFAWRGPGVFEVHVFFDQHGWAIIDLARRMLVEMRANYGARAFWSAVPDHNRQVKTLARRMGWKSHGVSEFQHGPCEVFSTENMLCLL